MSSASRSLTALRYSVRFRRCRTGRPGFGVAAASIEATFEPRQQAGLRRGIWMRNAGRRHRARSQFPHDLFPHRRVSRNVAEIDGVEDDT